MKIFSVNKRANNISYLEVTFSTAYFKCSLINRGFDCWNYSDCHVHLCLLMWLTVELCSTLHTDLHAVLSADIFIHLNSYAGIYGIRKIYSGIWKNFSSVLPCFKYNFLKTSQTTHYLVYYCKPSSRAVSDHIYFRAIICGKICKELKNHPTSFF